MAKEKRRPVDRRNREHEVVEAAIKVFYEKGYAASTIQDVADVVGVLKGSLYHYISSKEDLLFRILQESHEQTRELMTEISELDVAPLERLQSYLERTYLWYLAHPERVSVYFNQQHHLTGENRGEMRVQMREYEHYLRELLAEAKGAGGLRADLDLKLASFFLLGALNSLPSWYRPGGAYAPEHIAREFTAMSMRTLTQAEPPSSAARPGRPATSGRGRARA
ncbi:TetR/AcrR family transcriptional regulator [Sporichthya sp.]|uniref:TetR/AcrR family transcriptional regulator n=1 Tax=Sporichthya sp. TaxID=65475 RepID=UPI00182275AA|nr:TetR/AcrR family transcriptional regulator [Sporichthya sp.]MBA3743568.1 TetR/AcrR family transcriptional regulator [Sporichthya sp.]